MIERRSGAGFLREALHAVMVRRERRRQDLDRDDSIQPGIFCAIHFAHSARAEQRLDLVRPQLRS